VLLFAAFFNTSAGIIYSIHCQRKISEVQQLINQDNRTLQQSEIARMEKVLQSSYTASLIFATAIIVIGLILIFIHSSQLWKGIALGLLILGTTLHVVEHFSMKKNADYKQKIERLNYS
jgi:uncharacterized membrane protein